MPRGSPEPVWCGPDRRARAARSRPPCYSWGCHETRLAHIADTGFFRLFRSHAQGRRRWGLLRFVSARLRVRGQLCRVPVLRPVCLALVSPGLVFTAGRRPLLLALGERCRAADQRQGSAAASRFAAGVAGCSGPAGRCACRLPRQHEKPLPRQPSSQVCRLGQVAGQSPFAPIVPFHAPGHGSIHYFAHGPPVVCAKEFRARTLRQPRDERQLSGIAAVLD